MPTKTAALAATAALALLTGDPALAAKKAATGSPDVRAEQLIRRMSFDEKIGLLHGHVPMFMHPTPAGVQSSAGYVAGIARLGVPALKESDASLGVANAGRKDDDATALSSGLALASTWSEATAEAAGAMIGKETRQKGFNVLLAGGVDLVREPRNGRNFEYLGEDPLLAGRLDAASIRGIQSQHVVSTAKHYAVNDQETGRMTASAEIGEAAMRESDLLAFELAIEGGKPGSIMCAYNRVNGVYACEHPHLLNEVLKRDWGYKGWVMSDWGAVHSVAPAANGGLDQESGQEFDKQVAFDAKLKEAVAKGEVSQARIDDMVRRILRSMIAGGLFESTDPGKLDVRADSAVALKGAEEGIVLLKNQGGLLPLAASAKRIAVIGGHADIGVLSGGGSSQVIPQGSTRFPASKPAPSWTQGMIFHPSAPLKAIRDLAPKAEVSFDAGTDPAAAAAAAKAADVAIVFVTHWASEGMDVPSLSLPDNQDALVEAVAAANPHTIVVLESGVPNLMPWADKVGAIAEAWYPGHRGGEAIANVLFGKVAPSGRLPVTFPAAESQLPNPTLPGAGQAEDARFDIPYKEGSDVGYRWFAKTGQKPLFPFGYGLTYTSFRYSGLKLAGGKTVTASFTVTNTGQRAGTEVAQVYLKAEPHRTQQRLIGWSRLTLKPGESRTVTLAADPRLLADWDSNGWRVDAGAYQVFVGPDAETVALSGHAQVAAAHLKP